MLGIVYSFDGGNKEIRALISSGLFAEFIASTTPLFRFFKKKSTNFYIFVYFLKVDNDKNGNQIFLYEKTEGNQEENRVFVRNIMLLPIKNTSQKLMGFISV